MRKTLAMLMLLMPVVVSAQTHSTFCQARSVGDGTEVQLIGCGEGFRDNLLWNLDRADSRDGALDGWTHAPATGRGVVVYVCDSGIMRDHDEFARPDGSNVIAGFVAQPWGGGPCADPALHPCDDGTAMRWTTSHGTGVASVIAGIHTGVAPDAKLVSVATLGETGATWLDAFGKVIQHAWDPATPPFRTAIVNMSSMPGLATGDSTHKPFRDADLVTARMRDMIGGVDRDGRPDPNGKHFLFVVIAGNAMEPSGTSKLRGQCTADGLVNLYPANLGNAIDGLITVGGITRANEVWDRSCGGSAVDILAPADDILVAMFSGRDRYRSHASIGGYPMNSGTSYAAPFVAGLAACLLETNPDLTPVELEQRLKATATFVNVPEGKDARGRVGSYDFSSEPAQRGPRRRAVRH